MRLADDGGDRARGCTESQGIDKSVGDEVCDIAKGIVTNNIARNARWRERDSRRNRAEEEGGDEGESERVHF